MSYVTNVILTFYILEDEDVRMYEVNEFLKNGAQPGFKKPIHSEGYGDAISDYIGGGKNTETFIYVAAFNYLEKDGFLHHLRHHVAWEYRSNVRLYMLGEQDEAFEEHFHQAEST